MLSIQLNYMHEHGPFLFIKIGGTLVQRIAQLTVEQESDERLKKLRNVYVYVKTTKIS